MLTIVLESVVMTPRSTRLERVEVFRMADIAEYVIPACMVRDALNDSADRPAGYYYQLLDSDGSIIEL